MRLGQNQPPQNYMNAIWTSHPSLMHDDDLAITDPIVYVANSQNCG